MTKRLTMTALAKECGVSRATMSAVINGRTQSQRISAKTAKRVQDFLDERGYVQSKSAMELRAGNKTKNTGILFCGAFMTFSHLMEALSIFVETFKKENNFAEIISISAEAPFSGLREYVARGIDKLLWIHAESPENEWQNAQQIFPLLEQINHVVVYNFDRYCDDWEKEYLSRGIDLVGFDRVAAYKKVAEKLVATGHKSVALTEVFTNHPTQTIPSTKHLIKAFTDSGLEVFGLLSPDMINPPIGAAEATARNLLNLYKNNKTRAAFIRHDLTALKTIRFLEQNGLETPDDITIIGFNGQDFSTLTNPSLATIAFPVKELCYTAINYLNQGKQKKYGRLSYLENILISGQSFPD